MPLRRARVLLVLLTALLLPALPAAAALPGPASGPARPLLEAGLPGQGWTAAAVSTDGGQVTSTVRLSEVALPFQAGVRIYDAAGAVVYSATITYLSADEGALVEVAPVDGISVGHDAYVPSSARAAEVEVKVTLNGARSAEHVGDHTIVLWLASRAAREGTWAVAGAPGTSLEGATSGPEVFLATSRDFDGTANVQAGSSGLAARAQVSTRRSVRVRRLLVGSFAPVLTSVDVLAVQTPRGTRQCVPTCDFSALSGPAAAGPGTYVFTLTGAGAGGKVQNVGDVLLGGADLVLPLPLP